MKTAETKTATCRCCQARYEYTEANAHLLLPFLCWKCTDAANAKFESQPPRRRERIFFTKL